MGRAGLLFGLAAAVAFIAGLLFPIDFINLILAFVAIIALGWGAGYTAAKVSGAGAGQGAGRGAGAGAIAGIIQLVLLTILLLVLVNIPAVSATLDQAVSQAAQQNPELGDAGVTGAAVGNIVGVTGGLLCGGINFVLMTIAGLIGGLMWRGTPDRGEYVAAGRSGGGAGYGGTGAASTYDTGSTTGYGQTGTTGTASTYDASSTGYGQTGTTGTTEYGSTTGTTGTTGDQGEGEGGVRVYDTDDRNRM